MLKIKLKSLAAEAKIIRQEEQKRPQHKLREEMYLHRIHVVRAAARETHIAYGLLRGRPLERIEKPNSRPYNKASVDKMLAKYGPIKAPVAQMAEQPALNREAGGSTPSGRATLLQRMGLSGILARRSA